LYLILGVIVAANHCYLSGLGTVSSILSAALAIILWPALLFGADLHLSLGYASAAGHALGGSVRG